MKLAAVRPPGGASGRHKRSCRQAGSVSALLCLLFTSSAPSGLRACFWPFSLLIPPTHGRQVIEPKLKAFLYTWGEGRVTAEGERIPGEPACLSACLPHRMPAPSPNGMLASPSCLSRSAALMGRPAAGLAKLVYSPTRPPAHPRSAVRVP